MLSYALAIAVAISSLVLFLTAFVMSDVHRRDDFLWSGVGLLYALVLWFCARNITGAVLLGQAAATALLVSYSWQTLKLRKAIAHPNKTAEIANFSILQKVNSLLQRNRTPVPPTTTAETPITPKVTEQEIAIPNTVSNNTVRETGVKDSDTESPVAGDPADTSKATADSPSVTQTTDVSDKKTQISPTQPQQTAQSKSKLETVDTEFPVTTDTVNENKVSSNSPSETQTAEPTSKTIQIPTTEAQQITETKEVIQKNLDRSAARQTIESNVAMPTETEDLSNAATEEEKRSQATDINIKPVSETTAPETKPSSKASGIDSLETVEVAEVLEATTDARTLDPNSERDNIIEVTTTEINITTEVKKIENESEED